MELAVITVDARVGLVQKIRLVRSGSVVVGTGTVCIRATGRGTVGVGSSGVGLQDSLAAEEGSIACIGLTPRPPVVPLVP